LLFRHVVGGGLGVEERLKWHGENF
jgi:hypothetical protein